MGYYRLNFDSSLRDSWFLGAPCNDRFDEIDPRLFTVGARFEGSVDGFSIPVRQQGKKLPFNLASLDMPVASANVVDAIARQLTLNMQRLAMPIDGENENQYEVLNVLDLLPALDSKNSRIVYWGVDDGRPEMVGRIRMITNLAIDRVAAGGSHIFRIQGWTLPIIVSEEFKRLSMHAGWRGATFQELPSR